MPRDGSNVYNPPTGTAAVSGDTISSSAYNSFVQDLTADLNAARPISAGGTGATTAATARTALGVAAADSRLIPFAAGMVMPYAGGVTTPDGWLLCYGQAISRTTYAGLFAAIGTTWGSGNGSSTFNVPDLRGRVVAGKDDMGGTSANRLTNQSGGLDGDTLGATGGSETHTLTSAQMPSHTHTATVTDPGHSHTVSRRSTGIAKDGSGVEYNDYYGPPENVTTSTATTGVTVSNAATGSGGAHNNVQPTAILNFIIKT